MKLLFVSSKVESRIAALEKAGTSGKALAKKATGIIEKLASGNFQHHTDAVGSFTKYGEKRIQYCRKYDLGCGYRLIILQRGSTLVIPFLGTHDECQRWLRNNSRLKAFNAGNGHVIHIENRKAPISNLRDVENMELDEDADGLLQNLTDEDLRTVFNGLVAGVRKKPR